MVKGSRVAAGSLIFKFEISPPIPALTFSTTRCHCASGTRRKTERSMQFFIAAEGVVDVGFEFADLVYFSIDLGNLAVGHGSIGGRFFEVRRAVGGNDQRELVAQTEGQQAEGSDFAGGIHPDFFVSPWAAW